MIVIKIIEDHEKYINVLEDRFGSNAYIVKKYKEAIESKSKISILNKKNKTYIFVNEVNVSNLAKTLNSLI